MDNFLLPSFQVMLLFNYKCQKTWLLTGCILYQGANLQALQGYCIVTLLFTVRCLCSFGQGSLVFAALNLPTDSKCGVYTPMCAETLTQLSPCQLHCC